MVIQGLLWNANDPNGCKAYLNEDPTGSLTSRPSKLTNAGTHADCIGVS